MAPPDSAPFLKASEFIRTNPFPQEFFGSEEPAGLPSRSAVEHVPVEGQIALLRSSGGSSSAVEDDSDDNAFNRGSVEAFPLRATPYTSIDQVRLSKNLSQFISVGG